MTPAIPVIDLDAAEAGDRSQLGAVRAATEDLGAVQVVNHGVPQDLAADLSARMDRLLSLPRAEKAKLASPHPYRGWRQWPDDFGRLELERFNVAQFDDVEAARAAGLAEDYLGLYATAQGLPADAFGLGALPHLRLTVNDYPTWTYPEETADSPSEPEGRGADWTEERGTSDEGRRRLKAPRRRAVDSDKLLLLEHADDSAVTVLAQQGDYEGLQLQGPDGEWIPIPVIPGALQVLSGQ